ncbi:MAG: Smr/MutS family protein [Gemmatimonadales bacterium]
MPKRRPRTPRWDLHDPLLDAHPVAELDLHGHTREEARGATELFLQRCRRSNSAQVVHIITGRGRGSAGGPVLKPLLKRLLAGELSRYVSEFGEDDDGGGFKVRVK